DFVNKNVEDFESRKLLKISIKADYRESEKNIIDPSSYLDFFKKNNKIRKKFEEQILNKFPRSFTKDLLLVDDSLKKSTLNITNQLKISGPSDIVDSLEIITPNSEEKKKKLEATLNSGKVEKVILLKSDFFNPDFKKGE